MATPTGHIDDHPETVAVAQLPLPAYVWRADGETLRLTDCNGPGIQVEPHAPDLFGLTLEEFAEWAPDIAASIRRAYDQRTVVTMEGPYTAHSDGIERRLSGTYVYAPPDTVIVHIDDVTERRRDERALQEMSERFRAAFEDSPLGKALISVDDGADHRIVEVNDAFCSMFGYDRTALVGRTIPTEFIAAEDAEIDRDAIARLRAAEIGSCQFEKRFLRGDGRVFSGTVWISLLRDLDGDGRLALCQVQDITERRSAEAALRASEARYRQIVETTSEGVWLVDAAHRTTFVNERGAELLGYRVNEMLGTSLANYTADGRIPPMGDTLARRGPGARQHETQLRRRDGSLIWVDMSYDALPSADGSYVGALAMMRDITERKRAERELNETKVRFEEAFAHAPNGMALVSAAEDSFGELLLVNAAFCRLLGHEQDGLVGRRMHELTHPDDVERGLALARALVNGEVTTYETDKRMLKATGEVVLTNNCASIVNDADGAMQHIIVHVQDVTARRRAEQEIEDSERRFRAAFSLALDAMVILDDHRVLAAGNRAAAALLGIEPGDIHGRRLDDFAHGEPDDLRAMWSRFLAAGEMTGQFELRRSDGEIRHVEFGARANFTPGRHIASMRDVTERERAAEARERAREEAQQLEAALHQSQRMETVGQLAGGVAHDFNNLLAVILNSCDFALAGLGDERAVEDIEAARSAAQHAAELTRQLLVFSRRDVAEIEVLDINDLVADVERLLRRTIRDDIELDVRLADQPAPVEADPSHLEQVLLNLAVNARDAMPMGGTLRIETGTVVLGRDDPRVQLGAKPGSYARLTVTDTGCGMSDEVLARAFEPFFTTKAQGLGTGLGLATTYGIVNQNGGHIELESELGAGTRAEVLLPLASCDAVRAAHQDVVAPRRRRDGHILIVEDEDTVRGIVQRILESGGYAVEVAADGDAALRIAQTAAFDAVVTDVAMPGMSGPQLVGRLRETRADLPAIFISGYTERPGTLPEDAVFLGKPFRAADLLDQVAEALDR